MKQLFITLISIIGSCSLAFAGDKQPVISSVPESSFGAAKVFATSIIEDSDAIYGGGVSLEVPVVLGLNLEVTGSYFEDDTFSAGANLLYYVPIVQNLNLYTLTGGGYEFETDRWYVGVGGGVSYSFTNQWSLFADGQYNFLPEGSDNEGTTSVRLGVKYSF